MNVQQKKVFVGLSGGVDSAVSAHILLSLGYQVVGGFMLTYRENTPRCTTREDLDQARRVADFLKIPLHVGDYRQHYYDRIIRGMVDEYRSGKTPNPDVWCNRYIKFDLFFQDACEHGFDMIATGHYARLVKDGSLFRLFVGVDKNKDQSYFLSRLQPDQCKSALFPVGIMTKEEVRRYARAISLPNADRKDSQGLCFVGNVGLKTFLKQYIPPCQGDILTHTGEKIGTHDGAWYRTCGQRRGLGLPPGWHVFATDTKNNIVFVCPREHNNLFTKAVVCYQRHWFADYHPHNLPHEYLVCKVRYRQKRHSCRYHDGCVYFRIPQWGVASGQILVLAHAQTGEIIGSAIIGPKKE